MGILRIDVVPIAPIDGLLTYEAKAIVPENGRAARYYAVFGGHTELKPRETISGIIEALVHVVASLPVTLGRIGKDLEQDIRDGKNVALMRMFINEFEIPPKRDSGFMDYHLKYDDRRDVTPNDLLNWRIGIMNHFAQMTLFEAFIEIETS